MSQPCQDNFSTTFSSLTAMMKYHEEQVKNSNWERIEVNRLQVAPLDQSSPLFSDTSAFADCVSGDAIKDTASNLGLALKLDGKYYPVRNTAYKGLLDRAKLGGTSLPKLKRKELAGMINSCLRLYPNAQALMLIRNEKISAAHSGDEHDYSILSMDELMSALTDHLDREYPGSVFEAGYSDHAFTNATWLLNGKRDELLDTYEKTLKAQGKGSLVSKLTPGIQFSSSDTGHASAKVSAMLLGGQHPIHIGGILAIEHRRQKTVAHFEKELAQLFAQFGDSIARLEKLTRIHLDYPGNTMTRICKKLALPKKASLEAIAMFDMALGGTPATAHDVYMAMQEILFILKTDGTPQGKLILLAENMARALTLRWSEYDLAKAVSW
ncbi:MAG TPA: hypothetical protein DEB31_01040 [Clostridiales bacterium]|nr:hypothetical protein [Clostridiales bacterium]